MNTKRKKKYNKRRKFFNSEHPHCSSCGSKFVKVKDLNGTVISSAACPLC